MPGFVAAAVSFLASSTIAAAIARVAIGFAISAAVQAKQRARAAGFQDSGIRNKFTGEGEDTPQSILLGYYATAGTQMAPMYTHSRGSSSTSLSETLEQVIQRINLGTLDPRPEFGSITNGDYATFLISLGDAPISALRGVYIDGTFFSIETLNQGTVHPYYGMSVPSGGDLDRFAGRVWVKFYDGTQTDPDQYLLSAYGAHPTRPWKPTSVHTGSPYAIITLRRTRDMFQTFVAKTGIRFVYNGMELLDPRTGVVAYTENPVVMMWNIGRGITMPDGSVFGMSIDVADMPADYWHTAMDACDALVENQDGSTEPLYRAGMEIPIATPDDGGMDPLTAWDELMAVCEAKVVNMGGTWLIRVGPTSAPVVSLTDADFLVTEEQSQDPFDGLESTFNVVTATFPSPDDKWEVKEAPRKVDAAAVARDGQEFPTNLQLNACPFPDQVQRVMSSQLRDLQRRVSHANALSPGYGVLPLDAISWTSDLFPYSAKTFEVNNMVLSLETGATAIRFRETDPSDFDVVPGDYDPQPVTVVTTPPPPPIAFTQADAQPYIHTDGSQNRIPAIRLSWSIDTTLLTGVGWEITRAGVEVASGSTAFPQTGYYITSENLIRDTEYQVVLTPIISGQDGTPWPAITVRTDDVGIAVDGLSDEVWDRVADDAATAASAVLDIYDGETVEPISDRVRDAVGRLDDSDENALWSVVQLGEVRENGRRDVAIATANVQALITEEREARVVVEELLAAAIDDNAALISSERTARASETSALAQSITSVGTEVGENSAEITQLVASVDGLEAEFILQLDVNGHISGLVIRAEVDDSGAVVSQAAFVADKFAIVGPGANPTTPFSVIATETVIDGVTVPAGTYIDQAFIRNGLITSAMIADAAIGRAKIADSIESDDYAEDANGRPTDGIRLDFDTGLIKTAGIVISRNIVLAEGSFFISGTISDGVEYKFVNTGIRMGRDDVWAALRSAVSISAAIEGTGSVPDPFDPLNTFWGLEAYPVTGARFFGFGAGAPPSPLSQDPAVLVDWPEASGTDQRLLFNVRAHMQGGITFSGVNVRWKVFLIT